MKRVTINRVRSIKNLDLLVFKDYHIQTSYLDNAEIVFAILKTSVRCKFCQNNALEIGYVRPDSFTPDDKLIVYRLLCTGCKAFSAGSLYPSIYRRLDNFQHVIGSSSFIHTPQESF